MTVRRHATRACLLLALGALLFYVTRAVPDPGGGTWTVAAVGFLLVAGTLAGDLVALLGLPHLTGYLLAGVVCGPHVLRLVDEPTVRGLSPVNMLALALIALAGGAELDLAVLRRGARSLAWAMIVQSLLVFVLASAAFLAVRPLVPFARALPAAPLLGAAMLWGALAVTRSPAATLAILSQTRARGPLASFTLGFVMLSDLVVIVLVAAVLGFARPLLDASSSLSSASFVRLGHDLSGSVALGTTLGLVLAAYLRLVDRQMIVVLLLLGFGVTSLLDYLQFDALLTFMVAGFIVRNLSRQGARFLQHIEQAGTVVYVVFFATTGAALQLPLLRQMWPVALLMAGARALLTWAAAALAGRLAADPPELQRWGWSGLVSQAGLALGLAALVQKEFPSLGTGFAALVIGSLAINQLAGPVLFKLALDRTGETAPERVSSLADA